MVLRCCCSTGIPKPTPCVHLLVADQMVESYRLGGIMPSMRHLHSALDKLEPLLTETPGIKTVACHHGSVLTGGLAPYIKALRENDVTAAALA